jgi:hypothetical protein
MANGGAAGRDWGGGVCNTGTIAIDSLTAVIGNQADAFADRFGC